MVLAIVAYEEDQRFLRLRSFLLLRGEPVVFLAFVDRAAALDL
jgi:hypothetical protein